MPPKISKAKAMTSAERKRK